MTVCSTTIFYVFVNDDFWSLNIFKNTLQKNQFKPPTLSSKTSIGFELNFNSVCAADHLLSPDRFRKAWFNYEPTKYVGSILIFDEDDITSSFTTKSVKQFQMSLPSETCFFSG